MTRWQFLTLIALVINWPAQTPTASAQTARLVETRKIWDQAPHNAFTDLVRFKDHFYCVFREGMGHVSPDGALRVLKSSDGTEWESAALITSENSDLRDAKITVTPGGQLMLCGAEALHDRSAHSHQSLAWFSDDGTNWGEKHAIGDPDFWLWRITWHDDQAFGIGYGCNQQPRSVRLYQSDDGRTFETRVENLFDQGYPNESSIVFDDDTAYCLLRRDGNPNTALIGISQNPYTDWQWKDLGVRIGGPHMVKLDDGRLLAAVRLHDGNVRTSLCWIDVQEGKLTEFLALPSGGDTSYAGLVSHEGRLWVSYYSSHEGKTSIYLASVELPPRISPKSVGTVINIGSKRELFVDDYLIDKKTGLDLVPLQPEPKEVALVCDAPWEGNTSAYHTIFADDDRFRMYYRGSHWDAEAKTSTHPEFTCYAESRDGISWTKPNLGLFEFQGSRDNNIVWAGDSNHNFTPFKDSKPDCAPDARYKALAGSAIRWNGTGLLAFQSGDGIHWKRMRDDPVITDGDFDSQNLAFWCPVKNQYLAYHRKFRDGIRDIMVSTSQDFLDWSEAQYLKYGDASVEQLYTNAIQPYPLAPHLMVGFPTRFQPENQQVEPVLMTSRDGRNFRRWPKPLIPITAPENRDGNRSNYMTSGLLILPHQDSELSVYATEAYYEGPGSRVRRFTFRTDGFVALRASEAAGEFTTHPLRFDGEHLIINFRSFDSGNLKVEIRSIDGVPLDGFSLDDCQPIAGDAIDHRVVWSSGKEVSELIGQPIRLRVVMLDAELFSIRFAK